MCFQSSQWSVDGAVCVFQLKGHITPVRTLAFSPDGMALASGGVGGLMNIWSLRVSRGKEAEPVRTVGICKRESSSVCVSVCVCLPGRLSAPESGRRFRSHPEHCLDPGCGRGRLFQQVKGQAPQHFFVCLFVFLAAIRVICASVSVVCDCVSARTPTPRRTCWW